MAALIRLTSKDRTDLPMPQAGTKILRAKEHARLLEAADIIEAVRERAREIEAQAEETYRRRYDEGYADGLEAGRMENAEKMMETVLASVEFIEGIENTVVDVVNRSIRKVIGDIDAEERVRRIVGTALAHVRGEQKVTVRVSPADESAVSKALAAMTSGSYLNVVADPRLKRDSCILESDLGVIDASLETQLKALERAFSAKIRK